MPTTASALSRRVARRFAAGFPAALAGPKGPGNGGKELRLVGREAEYPVVWPDGNAADVRLLLRHLQDNGRGLSHFDPTHEGLPSHFDGEQRQLTGLRAPDGKLEVVLEVGWGTVEVITGPFEDLFEMKTKHEEAMGLVVESASRLGMKVLSCGLQPRTPPSLDLMTPRPRYLTMREILGHDIWEAWCVTASDQIHVDVCAGEIASVNNLVNLLHAMVVAVCGNSALMAGKRSEFMCARQGLMRGLGTRHGMPERPFDDIEEHITGINQFPLMWIRDEKQELEIVNDRSFEEWASARRASLGPGGPPAPAEGECDEAEWDAFLLHDHYVWHSARPRFKQGTVECRAACQQPWPEHMAAAALHLGMVEACEDVWETVLGRFGSRGEAWAAMQSAVPLAEEHGLAAFDASSGDAAALEPEFLRRILDDCRNGLESRGLGEEVLMDPLFRRLGELRNPAQSSVEVAEAKGLPGLLSHFEVAV